MCARRLFGMPRAWLRRGWEYETGDIPTGSDISNRYIVNTEGSYVGTVSY